MTCAVSGCDRAVRTRGWCERHYRRWLSHGDPLAGRRPDGEALEWLKANFDAPSSGPCVLWPFLRNDDGYGKVWTEGRYRGAHALATEMREGPAAPGQMACHDCASRLCVIHVRWGSSSDNAKDRVVDPTHRPWLG